MSRRSRDQALSTVLFTDIVGSTKIASELGDRRWRTLLQRHHRIVREELRKLGGREVDTAGDGFFAVFDEPSRALRCAAAVSGRVRELGIEIRAGLNFGETERIGGKPGGIAVHAASRIMAMAGPGEVLVSSTVRDLVPGSGFSFDDRGTHELRDVPGEWRIFALTAVDGTPREPPPPPEEAAELRQAIEPPPLLRRRGARVGALVVVVLVIAAAAIAVPLATRGSPAGSASPGPTATGPVDRLAKINAGEKRVVATYPVVDHPSAVAFGEGSVWVTSATTKVVARLDPVTGKIKRIPMNATADSIAVGEGAAWVGNSIAGTVSMIDALTNEVRTIDLGLGVGTHHVAVAVDDATGTVWASFSRTGALSEGAAYFDIGRIDPTSASFSVIARSNGGNYFCTLAAGDGSVWFADDGGGVVRLDARSGRVVWRKHYGISFWASAAGDDTGWLGSANVRPVSLEEGTGGGALVSIATTSNKGDFISIGGGPTGIAILGQGVYVSDLLGVVHPYAGQSVLPAIPVGGEATGIAAGEGLLWVSVNEK